MSPKKGYKQSPEHKKKLSKAVEGEKNGQYKDGRRSYRTKMNCENNDGTVIHHKNNNRLDNKKSNLVKLKGKKAGATSTSTHEKIHKRTAIKTTKKKK